MKLYFSKISSVEDKKKCLQEASRRYLDMSLDSSQELVSHNKEGKPFLKNDSVKISVSHTGTYWFGAFHNKNIGIDFELAKPRDITRLAERFFSKIEQEFINLEGERGFYQIWTGKEAFVKNDGRGLFKGKIADNEMVHRQKNSISLKSKFKDGTMFSLEPLVEELKDKGYIDKGDRLYGSLFVEDLNLNEDYLESIEIVCMDR